MSLPNGWTESSPGGMAINLDPRHGGIINKRSNKEWFIVFNHNGLDSIEGLSTRENAFDAYAKEIANLPSSRSLTTSAR